MLNHLQKRAKALIDFGFILLFTSCGFQADKVQKIGQYFDIETFISGQIAALSDTSLLYIEKEMELDGQSEIAQIKPDSATLVKEFQFWLDADINKSSNRDAFTITVKNVDDAEITKYIPKDESTQNVKLMQIEKIADKLSRIEILHKEENSIYLSERKLIMLLNNEERIEEYSIRGYQKMILKTPIQYTIKGKFNLN